MLQRRHRLGRRGLGQRAPHLHMRRWEDGEERGDDRGRPVGSARDGRHVGALREEELRVRRQRWLPSACRERAVQRGVDLGPAAPRHLHDHETWESVGGVAEAHRSQRRGHRAPVCCRRPHPAALWLRRARRCARRCVETADGDDDVSQQSALASHLRWARLLRRAMLARVRAPDQREALECRVRGLGATRVWNTHWRGDAHSFRQTRSAQRLSSDTQVHSDQRRRWLDSVQDRREGGCADQDLRHRRGAHSCIFDQRSRQADGDRCRPVRLEASRTQVELERGASHRRQRVLHYCGHCRPAVDDSHLSQLKNGCRLCQHLVHDRLHLRQRCLLQRDGRLLDGKRCIGVGSARARHILVLNRKVRRHNRDSCCCARGWELENERR
mmetsp:Transcript_14311/g.33885  ORF Transcript_14311/g.33885 Transcript_14311/m.33885 type:complete len:385 (-) Transcript_14311:1218-2372(-)